AQTSFDGLKTGYGYFKRILEDDPQDFYEFRGSQPAEGNGVYAYSGDISINNNWSIASGENYVVLVDGIVTINGNINVALGGFLAIISSGDIVIDAGVGSVQGVYIADGLIDTGASTSQLLAEGIFTGWGGFSLQRELTDNSLLAAEKFTYRPDLLSHAYRYLLKPRIHWQEVAP
ncbi:MAG: hypothetical protein V1810_02850, partial [Candidatus Beckwithbacteria bacterium]